MKTYIAVIEQGKDVWGAYVPDLPGCTSAGDTREEAITNVRAAIEIWLEEAVAVGEAIPEPGSSLVSVSLAA